MKTLKAGRALDDRVAREALKWEPRLSIVSDTLYRWVRPADPGSPFQWTTTRLIRHWHPSTETEDAVDLVNFMLEVFEVFELSYDGRLQIWHARFAGEPSNWESLWGHAETPMLAICIAAIQELRL